MAGNPTLNPSTFDVIKLRGESVTINSQNLTVLSRDPDGNVLLARGTATISSGASGYAKGALYIDTDVSTGTSGLYENIGTTTSCNFSLITGEGAPILYKDFTEVVAATNVITAAESGSVFFLNSATEFVSTLPAVAAGLHFTFIVTAAPSGASYTVVTNSSANIIKGKAFPADGAAGDTGSSDDTISFVDGQAVAGDKVEVWSDGTSWFAYAHCSVAAGVTFTTAS